jgi:membrane fusion protein (multidrug efflux system)
MHLGKKMRANLAVTVLTLVGLPLIAAGCDERSIAATAPTAAAPEVGIVTISAQPKPIVRELPGRIAPVRVADVRARVSGIVVARLFEQGSEVKAGDALYQIDPKPFEVDLQAAEAALAKAEAVAEQTRLQAQRTAALIVKQAASLAENEASQATARQAIADVAARKAEVARAKLNLDYATVRAPISGVIGAALVSEGALVVQNDTTSMATIQQLDTVYADFTQSAAELNRLRRDLDSGALERIAPDAAKVTLMLDEGAPYPAEGKLLFSDRKVDAFTGQVTLRGEFKNPTRELLPGMYVRVQIEQGIDTDAIVVPQQAVQRNSAGSSEVYVLNNENRALVRPVRTGTAIDGQWLILDGLKQGDRVVVEGFQKFAAGDAVTPGQWPRVVSVGDARVTQIR